MQALKLVSDLRFSYLTFTGAWANWSGCTCLKNQLSRDLILKVEVQFLAVQKEKDASIFSMQLIQVINNNHIIMNQNPKEAQKKSDFVDISLTFGDESSKSKQLVKAKLSVELGEKESELRSEINKFDDNCFQNDEHIKIQFNVPPGREKQAIQYLQKGINEPDEERRKSLNYIQRLLRKLNSGSVNFKQSDKKDGKVFVYYVLFMEQLSEFEQDYMNQLKLWTFNSKLDINFLIEGQEVKDYQENLMIEPTYSKIGVQFHSSAEEVCQIAKRVNSNLEKSHLLMMLMRGIKKIQLKSKLNIFQKIAKMYNSIAKDSDDQEDKKGKKTSNNLLEKRIKITVNWKKFGQWNFETQFQKEEYLHIILNKVMRTFENA